MDVRIAIDPDVCLGTAQCEALAPDAIELDDDGIARVRAGATLPRDLADEIVGKCPSGAIRIEED